MPMLNVTELAKHNTVSHEEPLVSLMLTGLLDMLNRDEIIDLLAVVESGGT